MESLYHYKKYYFNITHFIFLNGVILYIDDISTQNMRWDTSKYHYSNIIDIIFCETFFFFYYGPKRLEMFINSKNKVII